MNSLHYAREAGFERLSLNPCLISVQGQSQHMGLAQIYVSFSMFKLAAVQILARLWAAPLCLVQCRMF